MHISQVSYSCLKGRTARHDLAPVTIIFGPNFAGKTAVLDAIKLAALGCLPGVGKTNAAIYALASGPVLEATVQMDTGDTGSNRWVGRGKTVSIDTLPLPKPVHDALSVSLDMASFFDLSEAKRTEYLYTRLAGAGGLTHEKITIAVKNAKPKTEASEETERALGMVVAEIGVSSEQHEPAYVTLDHVIAYNAQQLKDATAYAKRMESTVQGLTQLAAQAAELDQQDPKALHARQEQAVKEYAAANLALGGLRAKRTAFTYAQDIREGAIVWLERNPAPEGDVSALTKEYEHHNSIVRECNARRTDLTTDLQTRLRASAVAENQTAAAAKDFANAQLAVDGFGALEACPTCGANHDGWKDQVLAKLVATRDEAQQTLIKARETEVSAVGVAGQARQNNEANEARASAHYDEANKAHRQLEAIRLAQVARERNQQLANQALPEEVTNEQLRAAQEDASKKAKAQSDAQAAYTRHAELRSQVEAGRKAEAQAKGAQAEMATYKAIGIVLAELKEEAVCLAVDAVLGTARAFCAGILKGDLVYQGNEFGYTLHTGQFVSYKTFSGTEQLVCFAAIALGLTATGLVRIAVLDELARLDARNLENVMANVLDLVAGGKLDQAIVVLPESDATKHFVGRWEANAADMGIATSSIDLCEPTNPADNL